MGGLLLCAQASWAQPTPANAPAPAAAASAPVAPSERAKRDADKVFQMILLHSDKKPVAKPAGKDAAPPSPPVAPSRSAPAAAQARPLPAPVPAAPAPAATLPAAPAVASKDTAVPAPTGAATPAEPVAPLPVAAPVDIQPALALPASPPPAPAAPIKLELLSSVEPEFPSRLVRTLGAGKVVVEFEVAADGTVTQAQAVQSSHRGLEAPAINAVKQWKFKPMAGSANGMTELKFE